MKVIEINDAYHIAHCSNGSTLCGKYINDVFVNGEFTSKSPVDEKPTCNECIKIFLDINGIRNSLASRLDVVNMEREAVLNALSHVINVQRVAGDTGHGCIESENGSYPFIPIPIGSIVGQLNAIKLQLAKDIRWSGHKSNTSYFLDAGCGCGNVMLIADAFRLCDKVHGIEYYEETAKRAEQWLGIGNDYCNYRKQFKIFRKDIMKFENYRKYDIIYYFCPFSDGRLQILFEERLENHMKVGAVLVPHLKIGRAICDDYRFECVDLGVRGQGPRVYIKTKSGRRKNSQKNSFHTEVTADTDYGKTIKKKYNL